MQPFIRKRRLLAAVCWLGIVMSPGAALACSLVEFQDDGRYVDGDLVTQIARKADTIQIVRVTHKYLVHRAYSLGGWYLNYGNTDLPADYPEFTEQFVFRFEIDETLKMEGDPNHVIYDDEPRVLGYDTSVLGDQFSPGSMGFSHPNQLPPWFTQRPGNEGYAFQAADQRSGLGGGECSPPYVLEVGQQFIALRDSLGRFYPASGAFPLEIDTEFRGQTGRTERFPLNMQSLVPISGRDDLFVQSLRAAITTDG
ncbi:MAG: hypothetical protein ACK4FB_14290 [Brevundimonas sp.]|uniref:hypothetical protein n=1 Tax=Brevundimonas sp. TaxID=1871086 RepID=UPI00391DA4D2